SKNPNFDAILNELEYILSYGLMKAFFVAIVKEFEKVNKIPQRIYHNSAANCFMSLTNDPPQDHILLSLNHNAVEKCAGDKSVTEIYQQLSDVLPKTITIKPMRFQLKL